MAAAARIYIVENGKDPRRCAMLGFGGAGKPSRCLPIPPIGALSDLLGLIVRGGPPTPARADATSACSIVTCSPGGAPPTNQHLNCSAIRSSIPTTFSVATPDRPLRSRGSASISVQAEGPLGTQGMQVLIKLAAAGQSRDDPWTDERGGQIERQFQQLDQPGTGLSRDWGHHTASAMTSDVGDHNKEAGPLQNSPHLRYPSQQGEGLLYWFRSDPPNLWTLPQQAVVAVQAGDHAVLRPDWSACGQACHVKDWRLRRVATQFGTVPVRLPRFRCGISAGCYYIKRSATAKVPHSILNDSMW
jgi:hypothetical protein